EFKADALNERSTRAILRIGATQEGVFRNHMIAESGRVRNSAYFSIIDSEWPGIKKNLERMLAV
ncbi:MAG: GNAT family N-acetyltransferase, partial [Acidobacteriota bacterium]|nr:GNAT family N-acetyltransferase [Acidobacteriota bacterium]